MLRANCPQSTPTLSLGVLQHNATMQGRFRPVTYLFLIQAFDPIEWCVKNSLLNRPLEQS